MFPIMQLLIFPWAANFEISNINLSVVDHDHSSYSRRLTQKIVSSGYFQLTDVSYFLTFVLYFNFELMAENLVTVENLSKSFGEKTLFEGLSFGINKGQKIALVAKNGTGKSTLLSVIMGKELADGGNISFRNDYSNSYCETSSFPG